MQKCVEGVMRRPLQRTTIRVTFVWELTSELAAIHLPYYAVELGTIHEGVRDNGSGGRETGLVTTPSFVGFCRSQVENAAHSLKKWQQL